MHFRLEKRSFTFCVMTAVLAMVLACGGGGGGSDPIYLTNFPPQISTVGAQTAVVGVPYSLQIIATDANERDVVSYKLMTYPAGMQIDSTGLITWTPTNNQLGENTVIVQASDGAGGSDNSVFVVTVTSPGGGTSANNSPVFATTPDEHATTVGEGFSYDIEATDPDGDTLTFSLSAKPSGMIISPNTGVITWVPTNSHVGENNVTVAVSDGHGGISYVSFKIYVAEFGDNLPVISLEDKTAYESAGFSYEDILAIDEDFDDLTYTLKSGPDWLELVDDGSPVPLSKKLRVKSNGLIPAGASDLSPYTVELKVQDSKYGVTFASFQLTVLPQPTANQPAVVGAIADQEVTMREVFRYCVSASDPEGDALSYTIINAPTGMAINAYTGVIGWRPLVSQVNQTYPSITVRVTDTHNAVSTATFNISVKYTKPLQNQVLKAFVAAEANDYTYQIPVVDSDGDGTRDFDYDGSISGVPDGTFAIAAGGLVTWDTPGPAGTYTVTVNLKQGLTTVETRTFDITVGSDIDFMNQGSGNWQEVTWNDSPPQGISIVDYNRDGRNDLVAFSNDSAFGFNHIARWTQNTSSALPSAPDSSVRSDNSLAGPVAIGDFYSNNVRDFVYLLDYDTSAYSIGLEVLPLSNPGASPIERRFFNIGADSDAEGLEIVDVYDDPNSTYDNCFEAVFIDTANRKLVVLNEMGVVCQTLDITKLADGQEMYLNVGDYNGDGYKDVVVLISWATEDFEYYNRLQYFFQEKNAGTSVYELTTGKTPSALSIDQLDASEKSASRKIEYRGMSTANLDSDTKDELAIAFYKEDLRYSTNAVRFSYVRVMKIDDATATPPTLTEFDAIGNRQKVWIASDGGTADRGAYCLQVRTDFSTPTTSTQNYYKVNVLFTRYTSSNTSGMTGGGMLENQCDSIAVAYAHPGYKNDFLDRKTILFGSATQGIVMFDGRTWSNTNLPIVGGVQSMKQTLNWNSGPLWAGTTGGLVKYDGSNFTQYTDAASPIFGLSSTSIRSIVSRESPDSEDFFKFIATDKGVTWIYGDQTEFLDDQRFKTAAGIVDEDVRDIAYDVHPVDGQKMMWYATAAGVSRHYVTFSLQGASTWQVNQNTFTNYTSANTATHFSEPPNGGLYNNTVNKVVVSTKAETPAASSQYYWSRWFGTASGAVRMVDTPGQPSWYRLNIGNISAMAVDANHMVWFARSDASNVYVYDESRYVPVQQDDGYSNGVPAEFQLGSTKAIFVEPHQWMDISAIKFADVNSDGKIDLVVCSNASKTVAGGSARQFVNGRMSVHLMTYSGGNFEFDQPAVNKYEVSVPKTTTFFKPYRQNIAVGDINNDGRNEVLFGNPVVGKVYLYKFIYTP